MTGPPMSLFRNTAQVVFLPDNRCACPAAFSRRGLCRAPAICLAFCNLFCDIRLNEAWKIAKAVRPARRALGAFTAARAVAARHPSLHSTCRRRVFCLMPILTTLASTRPEVAVHEAFRLELAQLELSQYHCSSVADDTAGPDWDFGAWNKRRGTVKQYVPKSSACCVS